MKKERHAGIAAGPLVASRVLSDRDAACVLFGLS
jgi:hypothetical protein